MNIEKLSAYATDRQKDILSAIASEGSERKAAKKLGIAKSTVSGAKKAVMKKAASMGYSPEHNLMHPVPDGFKLKGSSTLYDMATGEAKIQWIKSTIDTERQEQMIREACKSMVEDMPILPPRELNHNEYLSNIMAVYPIGDAHIGQRSWGLETGSGDWDLHIAERVQCGAMSALVDMTPRAEKAVIINLGDWFHSDNMEGTTTRSGHILDVDGRYGKMIGIGIKVMRQCIESALTRHANVHVVNAIGNHDDTGAIWLGVALSHIYANEPRITIDTNPSPFMYIEYGKTLIGIHHGHTCKTERLPGVMAADKAEEWGRTKWRYWYLGHVHHQNVKEYAGVTVESFNTLTAKDAYSAWGGYRSQQNMKSIVIHKEYGEVGRHTVNPAMLENSIS